MGKKKKYTLAEVEALDFRDIYKPIFETDGICYIYANVANQGFNLTALDLVDEEIKVPWKDDDIRIELVRIFGILNGYDTELHYDVEEVNTCGDGCIRLKNGLFLRVRGWGYLTSTYVDYDNPDHSVPVNQESHFGKFQDKFAEWVANKLDPEFHKGSIMALHERMAKNSVWGNYTGNWDTMQTNYSIKQLAVSRKYLQDWYQQSIDETQPPIWTDEHLDELFNDFYLIPKSIDINKMLYEVQ